VAILNDESGDRWGFGIPESGGTSSADSFVMPNGTENNELVERLIDFYYDPLIAAQVADYVWFVTPVAGAQEAMEEINPEQVDNPLIFPDAETQSRLYGFRVLTSAEDKKYSTEFQKVLGN
jgi:spermidine/putrescine transport system substrate-binding protein